MERFKCKYCFDTPITIYRDEPLCGKHYKELYSEKLSEVQLDEVNKVKEEVLLNKKYAKILNNFNFYNTSNSNTFKFNQLMKRFNRDVERVKAKNPLYFNVDKI